MASKKLHSSTDQRKFTMVYNDFLESDLLNAKEKLYHKIERIKEIKTLKTNICQTESIYKS